MTQGHAARCMLSLDVILPLDQLYAAMIVNTPLLLYDITCKLAPNHQMRSNTAKRRLPKRFWPTPLPVPTPMQVYGAMRKLALEQQAETAQLNAAVQQSGDKEDEDPDLDEDEADAKQVTFSWDAQIGLCSARSPSAFWIVLVFFLGEVASGLPLLKSGESASPSC